MDTTLKEKVFMKWVVPQNLYDGGCGEIQSARDPTPAALPATPQKQKSLTPRLPALAPQSPPSRCLNGTPARPLGSPRRSLASQVSEREKVATPRTPRSNVVIAPKAEELLKNANPSERRIIEKALLLSNYSATSDSLRRTLQPDAELRVRKWLETATPEEREIALTFFHKLAGNKEGITAEQNQKEKIFKVLETLEKGHPDTTLFQSHPTFSQGDGHPNLRYLRLLTPNTRKNRWMHSTWHHMPPYKDSDPRNNRSSHYLEAQKFVPRHYVIHPDWQ